MELRCPNCGSTALDAHPESQETVCTNCGDVVSGVALESEPVGAGGTSAPEQSMGFVERWAPVERRVRRMGEALHCSTSCIERAQNLIRVALKKPREGQPLETAAACCLVLASRRIATDGVLTLADAAKQSDAPEQRVRRQWAKLMSQLEGEREASQQARRSGEAARGLVDAYCNKLHAHALASGWPAAQSALLAPPTGAARALAGEAITLARREWILEGRHAEPCAAAALLLAARSHGLPFKAGNLAAIGMKANAKAPRERLKELTTVAVSLARQLPGRESLSDKALEKALHRFIPEINLARTLELEALRDGVDSDDDGDGEAAPGGGSSLVPVGAVVVRRDDSLLAALGASDPAAFVASAARRAVRERKLAAAQARIAAADGAGSTALVINGVRAEEEEAPLDAEDERIETALRQGTPHEAILGGHYEAAASDVGELSEGEEGGGDGALEEELGEGDVPLSPYRATSGLVRERTARHAEGGSSGLTTYMGDTSLDWGTEGEPPAKAPRWCDRSTPGP